MNTLHCNLSPSGTKLLLSLSSYLWFCVSAILVGDLGGMNGVFRLYVNSGACRFLPCRNLGRAGICNLG